MPDYLLKMMTYELILIIYGKDFTNYLYQLKI
jgi:hypothetical protein